MTNRITLLGKLLDAPKLRTLEGRGEPLEIVSLWIEAPSGDRADRFTVEITCPKAANTAKALRAGTLVEVQGQLRHDRWKDKTTSRWTGKIYVAIDPGQGQVRSKGMAETPEAA